MINEKNLLWKKSWCSVLNNPDSLIMQKYSLYGSTISIFTNGIFIGGYTFTLDILNSINLVKFIKKENLISYKVGNQKLITGNFEGVILYYYDEKTKSNESIFISSSENDVMIKKIIELTSKATTKQN